MQMRKAIVAGGLVVMLSGCGSSGGILNRARPNEFAVTRAAPLVVPPDFSLTPPAPGTPRAQEADSSQQALQAMFGGPAPRSDAEKAALAAAGAARTSPGIRSNVGDPGTNVADKGSVTRDIIAAPEGDGQDARATTPKN